MSSGGAEIVGDGFSDARSEPGKLLVGADVCEVEDGNCRRSRFCCRCMDLRRRRLRGRQRLDRRDESISAPGDGLNVGRLRWIVAERLAELGDGLCQRVVGHGDIRPQRGKQLVLAHECRLPRDEVEQQIDDLRRKRDDLSTAQEAVRAGVDGERAEAVRRNHCHWVRQKRPQHSIARAMLTETRRSSDLLFRT